MNAQKHFRILVVEDSEFFNQFLTNQLKWYLEDIAMHQGCSLEIDSFRTSYDCLKNLKEDTDVAFIDYFLEDGKTGMEVIESLKRKNAGCRIVVLSQKHSVDSAVNILKKYPVDYIYKDDNVFHKSCFITETLLNDKCRTVN